MKKTVVAFHCSLHIALGIHFQAIGEHEHMLRKLMRWVLAISLSLRKDVQQCLVHVIILTTVILIERELYT